MWLAILSKPAVVKETWRKEERKHAKKWLQYLAYGNKRAIASTAAAAALARSALSASLALITMGNRRRNDENEIEERKENTIEKRKW